MHARTHLTYGKKGKKEDQTHFQAGCFIVWPTACVIASAALPSPKPWGSPGPSSASLTHSRPHVSEVFFLARQVTLENLLCLGSLSANQRKFPGRFHPTLTLAKSLPVLVQRVPWMTRSLEKVMALLPSSANISARVSPIFVLPCFPFPSVT